MTYLFALLAGLGFGLFGGFYLGQRGGLTFVKRQLEMAGQAAEKMAQVLVAPYGHQHIDQAVQPTEEAFKSIEEDEERIPEWMDVGEAEAVA